jgi:hypothetical protein
MWYMIPGKSPRRYTSDRVRLEVPSPLRYLPASNSPSKNLVAATVANECTPAIPMVITPHENINSAIQVEGAMRLSR